MKKIPQHLKQYVVKQNYKHYTYIDQACWQFIMKISIDFFEKFADKVYKKGLEKTGITLNKIPRIETINKKLSTFGWNAVCVRGFIPPQAFMEFQSLKILPIAADMRSHKHLTYTPSPDIVHEAAGHAPIIANKDYANYLINYGEIASKAIMSSEDMELYYAIRDLSDIKENVHAAKKDISKYEQKLQAAYKNISYISESSLLSRMNWWTVEYGLIGHITNPKIYGAGLLSSVGESENCITNKVKKIPFSLDCLNYKYDITEQQPQLFVAPNYNFLSKELKNLSTKLSYKIGGIHGVETAIKAKTICTVEIDKQIQISGLVSRYIKTNNKINFIKLEGPSQICINNKEIKNHGIEYHSQGYSTPIGNILEYKKPLNKLNAEQIKKLKIQINKNVSLIFENNIQLQGTVTKIHKVDNQIRILTFKNCTVNYNNEVLFQPDWGFFDLICGNSITSVYGGPCDKVKYYSNSQSNSLYSEKYNTNTKVATNSKLNNLFKELKYIRTNKGYEKFYKKLKVQKINDWLLKYKLLESVSCDRNIEWINKLYYEIEELSQNNSDLSRAILRGLLLFK